MADYKQMYLTLVNEITDTIVRLQKSLQDAEDIYINTPEIRYRLIPKHKEPSEDD